jgi:hypothetical protein
VTCCSDSSVIGHSFAPTRTTDSLADKQRKPHGSAISLPIQTEAPSAGSAISALVRTEAPSAGSAISALVRKEAPSVSSAISASVRTEAPSASSGISAPVQTEAPSASSAISAPVQKEASSANPVATRGLGMTGLTPEQVVLRPPPAAASTVSSCEDLFGDSVNDDMFRDEFPSQLPPDRKVLRSLVVSWAVFRIQIYRIHMFFFSLPEHSS